MRTSRRELLGLVLVTGCSAAPTPPAPPLPPPPVDPDIALAAAAVLREQVLLRAYDAALLAAPSLTARLAPLRAEHAEHLAALAAATAASPAPVLSPSARPSPAAAVPVTQIPTVLAGLVQAERTAATGHAGDVAAASRALAGLLAALSASEASHPVALG